MYFLKTTVIFLFHLKFSFYPSSLYIFLLSWAFVQSLVLDFSNVLFWKHCVLKQNIWEVLYESSYEGSTE